MKLSIATTSIAALVFPRNVVGQFEPVGYCDPSLPCETTILSCPCATGSSVPSVGKSGKSSSLSGICGNNYFGSVPPVVLPDCCGIDGYPACWWFNVVYSGGGEYPPTGYYYEPCYPISNDPTQPACCGFGFYPPCGSSLASIGKSGKATSLASTTATCGNADGDPGPNPPCCGFEAYPPCTCDFCSGEGCCGEPFFPTCPSGFSAKAGKGYGGIYTGELDCLRIAGEGAVKPFSSLSFFGKRPASGEPASTSTLSMEQLSAEVNGAVEEAVEKMVNIGELNVYESSVNVYKYGDDGEGDVVNVK